MSSPHNQTRLYRSFCLSTISNFVCNVWSLEIAVFIYIYAYYFAQTFSDIGIFDHGLAIQLEDPFEGAGHGVS